MLKKNSLESVAQRYSVENLFFNISQNWKKKCLSEPASLFKKDYDVDFSLWILPNFSEHLFCKISFGDCFSILEDTWFLMGKKHALHVNDRNSKLIPWSCSK